MNPESVLYTNSLNIQDVCICEDTSNFDIVTEESPQIEVSDPEETFPEEISNADVSVPEVTFLKNIKC